MSTRIRYDFQALQRYCSEQNIRLAKDYSNDIITRDTRIEGQCLTDGCAEIFEKTHLLLVKSGGFCKKCMKQKYYQTNLKRYGVKYPSQSLKVQEKVRQTNLERYGVKYPSQSSKKQEKARQTILQRYGVEYPFQSSKVQEKFRKTNLRRYGVEYPSQSSYVKEKARQTNLLNYGVEYSMQNPVFKEKARQTTLLNYGVEYPSQSPEIQEKIRQTNLERHGVEYAMQNPKIAERSYLNSYRYSEYTFPSGETIKFQGYEHFALDELLQSFDEEDIVTGAKNVPLIWYLDDTGKKHSHTPDIFIPFINTCIEVKSTWTAKKNYHNIFRKQESAKALGFKYEIWIYNAKGEKVETHK